MTDARNAIHHIERAQETDWHREYACLLPPVLTPTRTLDCTCEWMEEKQLCVAESTYFHTRYGEDCPDHREPERVP